jgi:hypothetical protein
VKRVGKVVERTRRGKVVCWISKEMGRRMLRVKKKIGAEVMVLMVLLF